MCDDAAHEVGELARDRQPEAGSGLRVVCRRSTLLVLLEDLALQGRGDAYARVLDREMEAIAPVLHRYAHPASMGEFDRVADEVRDDLTDACRVADDPVRDVGVDLDDQVQISLGGKGREEVARFL